MYESDIYGGEGEPEGKLMRYDSLPFSLPLGASRIMHMRSNCGWRKRNHSKKKKSEKKCDRKKE